MGQIIYSLELLFEFKSSTNELLLLQVDLDLYVVVDFGVKARLQNLYVLVWLVCGPFPVGLIQFVINLRLHSGENTRLSRLIHIASLRSSPL